MLTPQQREHAIAADIASRQAEWLRQVYGITPHELEHSPLAFREEVTAAWSRHWRDQCEHGQGIVLERTGGTPRGAHRLP